MGTVMWSLQNDCPNMYRELVLRKLDILFEELDEANLMIVREFYANCPKHINHICTVRKKSVDASIKAIQRAYRLPMFGEDPNEEDYYNTHAEYQSRGRCSL